MNNLVTCLKDTSCDTNCIQSCINISSSKCLWIKYYSSIEIIIFNYNCLFICRIQLEWYLIINKKTMRTCCGYSNFCSFCFCCNNTIKVWFKTMIITCTNISKVIKSYTIINNSTITRGCHSNFIWWQSNKIIIEWCNIKFWNCIKWCFSNTCFTIPNLNWRTCICSIVYNIIYIKYVIWSIQLLFRNKNICYTSTRIGEYNCLTSTNSCFTTNTQWFIWIKINFSVSF